jgi:hypothetical protein
MAGILADLWSVGVRVSLDEGGGVRLSGLTSLPKDEARRILETVKTEKPGLVLEIQNQRQRHQKWKADLAQVGAAWDGQRILFSPFLGFDDTNNRWETSWKLIRGFVQDVPAK